MLKDKRIKFTQLPQLDRWTGAEQKSNTPCMLHASGLYVGLNDLSCRLSMIAPPFSETRCAQHVVPGSSGCRTPAVEPDQVIGTKPRREREREKQD